MKKLIGLALVVALLAYFGCLPFERSELAGLLPVKTVVVTRSGEQYTVDIGAGVRAVGNTLRQALDALTQEVSGEVFFQTVEQVVITQDAAAVLPEAAAEEAFRPSAAILLTDVQQPDAEALSAYFQAHPVQHTRAQLLAQMEQAQTLCVPRLTAADGGYRTVE